MPEARGLRALADSQLDRLYRRAYGRAAAGLAGGRRYGIDWRTLRLAAPGWHRALRAILDELDARERKARTHA